MTACARACTMWRRHVEPCPIRNGQDGAWVGVTNWVYLKHEKTGAPFLLADLPGAAEAREAEGWERQDPPEGAIEAHREYLRALTEDELQLAGYGLGRYGELQKWHECRGCQPRKAEHGVLCDQCYTRMLGWFGGKRNLAWCWYWLAQDLIPGQNAQGDKIRGTRTPPAAMSIAAHDLREELLAGMGGWLATVCGKFHLDGPAWFRRRLTEARRRQSVALKDVPPGMTWRELHEDRAPWAEMDWRAWLPQDAPLSPTDPTTEIQEACRYLAAWLDRICTVEDLAVSMYDQADRLYRQVRRVAPWEPKAQRMPDLVCPACEREALVRWEGDEHLTCRRCKEVVTRQRYDIWSAGLEQEKVGA